MTFQYLNFPGATLELFNAAKGAIGQIPPAFPLDATVAVNPFLGQLHESRALTAARLSKTAGIRIFPERSDYAARIADGRIKEGHLAATASSAGVSVADLRDAAKRATPIDTALPTVADLVAQETGIEWPGFVADRISLWAAVHFDEGQALWPAPKGGVFASWRAFASRDLSTGIAGLPGFAAHVASMPDDPRMALAMACEKLDLAPQSAPLYFHRLLMTLGGWAQLARSKGWLAERDGTRNDSCFDLLAVRLVWDAALLEVHDDKVKAKWHKTLSAYAEDLAPSKDHILDAALQDAADRASEDALATTLCGTPSPDATEERPAIQAAFCIDVRSEVFRRALEQSGPEVETIGFAGFFGLPVAHRAKASDIVEMRAPVLLNAGLESVSSGDPDADWAERLHRRAVRAWGRFKMAAVSAFAFVEAAGPLYVAKLVKDSRSHVKAVSYGDAPSVDLPDEARIAAGEQVLRAMSLTEGFARVVLIAGHGSSVTNAPHASALQCGACGGHAGDVNARLLAALLNDPVVRGGLVGKGIEIPEDTVFMAGLHDTVSDHVTLFHDLAMPEHGKDIERLEAVLAKAGAVARLERSVVLPRANDAEQLALRGGDWSDLRPEWGLAGCSAFIAAPRHRSVGRDLGGRSFLHSYDWHADKGFGTLELILTAPVVVASWISLQYYGSSVAPEAFGAGNKLIHNVTGGIGVVEGNGGLLRAGLPWQSVHDGDSLRHEPLRLHVVLEAPTEAISAVLDRNPDVRALFDNGWLALSAMDDQGQIAWRYDSGSWIPQIKEVERLSVA
ncbi:hypothetical protein RAZWK3B_02425 [Roseobacter sp. AzwK-3b]|uniref:YbcC family protein n=1 Tax=Roseobacter sp. AzwK-3b TaxID=351016 RepID=UPI00015697F4|nr:DUF2309 domain-containing protein [Roseobacter sp. AzwK-3b]EDM73039.1 hypothetical protein RAZWK3B_02425 [Roseobacter sp. AzwK-3b]